MPVDVGYPEDWRHRLREVSDRIKRDRLLERQLVAQAIAAGATWSAIGDVLGVKRQTAHERFRHVAPVVRVPS